MTEQIRPATASDLDAITALASAAGVLRRILAQDMSATPIRLAFREPRVPARL